MEMGFEYWEVGFGKKLGREMGLVPPPSGPSKHIELTEESGRNRDIPEDKAEIKAKRQQN